MELVLNRLRVLLESQDDTPELSVIERSLVFLMTLVDMECYRYGQSREDTHGGSITPLRGVEDMRIFEIPAVNGTDLVPFYSFKSTPKGTKRSFGHRIYRVDDIKNRDISDPYKNDPNRVYIWEMHDEDLDLNGTHTSPYLHTLVVFEASGNVLNYLSSTRPMQKRLLVGNLADCLECFPELILNFAEKLCDTGFKKKVYFKGEELPRDPLLFTHCCFGCDESGIASTPRRVELLLSDVGNDAESNIIHADAYNLDYHAHERTTLPREYLPHFMDLRSNLLNGPINGSVLGGTSAGKKGAKPKQRPNEDFRQPSGPPKRQRSHTTATGMCL